MTVGKNYFLKLTAFGVFRLDGLFQCRDVPEREQEQHDEIPLVLDRSYLHQQP